MGTPPIPDYLFHSEIVIEPGWLANEPEVVPELEKRDDA